MLWGGQRLMVRKQICRQRPSNGSLDMPDLENHWFAERLAYLGRSWSRVTVWRRKVGDAFPRLNSNPKAEGRRMIKGEVPFVLEWRKDLRNLLGFSDLSRSQNVLYRDLVVGSASDFLVETLGWSMEEVHSHWKWAPGSSFLYNSEFSLTWRLARYTLPLLGSNYKVVQADIPDCICWVVA